MESTGVLRRSPYQALEDCGFTSQKLVLANACDVKGKKGHKTDVIDAEHLATLGRLDAVKPESRLMLTQSLLPEESLPDPLH